MAIYFCGARWLSIVFALACIVCLLFVRPRKRAVDIVLIAILLVAIWYATISPSNNRPWQRDVVAFPTAIIDGDKVTIKNIRNCDYRSETDFDVHYYDKVYDLSKLRTLDLIISYWGPKLIAHTFVSFGFEGGDYLACSIETRKEVGEEYSAIEGFFKTYELIYLFADERDVIRLRTNYRKEDVYVYRLRARPEQVREVFLDYLREANDMAVHPQFYNALTNSCGMGIVYRLWGGHSKMPFQPRLLLNGYWDRYAYKFKAVDTSMPLDELRKRCHVNERGQKADRDPVFSLRIRDGLPMPPMRAIGEVPSFDD